MSLRSLYTFIHFKLLRSLQKIYLTLLLLGWFLTVFGQETKDTLAKRNRIFGVPIVFFAPETDWGFGAAGIYTFRLKGESLQSNPSQLQLGFAYTLNKQILLYLPYQLFKNEERLKIYGELGYYLYTYQFFGVGNATREEDLEFYDVNFPRIRLNVLKQVYPNIFIGGRYWLDDFKIQKVEEGGFLDQENITGSQGGFLSGLGAVGNYDTRDNIFFPTKGIFAEIVAFQNGKFVGSDFNFSKLYIDISSFWNFGEQVLATNFYGEFTKGEVPFNQLSLLGGPKRMRGFFEGRFRDHHFVSWQGEYRFPLFWKWLRGVAFVGVGEVAGTFSDFELANFKFNYGTGLRILVNQKEKVYIRLDAGFGENTSGFYITIGEAF